MADTLRKRHIFAEICWTDSRPTRSDRIAAPHARQAGCPLESGRGLKCKKNFTDLCRPLVHCIFGYYFCLHFLAISWCQVLHPVVWAQAQKRHVDQLSIHLLQNGGGAKRTWWSRLSRFSQHRFPSKRLDQDVETSYATLARDSLKASWFRPCEPINKRFFSNLCNNFNQKTKRIL